MAELAWIRDSLRLRRTTIDENGWQGGGARPWLPTFKAASAAGCGASVPRSSKPHAPVPPDEPAAQGGVLGASAELAASCSHPAHAPVAPAHCSVTIFRWNTLPFTSMRE